LPSLNQQEGTFVSIDKKVVNTNVALPFDGVCLNDLLNNLFEIKEKYTIDYTSQLPTKSGFKAISFDDLKNGFSKYGKDLRGYELESVDINSVDVDIDEISTIDTYNGSVVYRCEPLHQFNNNTAKSLLLQTNKHLRGSLSFATAAKIKDGDNVNITCDGITTNKVFKVDGNIKGTIALYPTFDNVLVDDNVTSGYRFKQVQIQKVD